MLLKRGAPPRAEPREEPAIALAFCASRKAFGALGGMR
jgi:hypothetical protein